MIETSSDLILIKDSRLLCPELFEQFPLLSPYFSYLIHEIISFLHFHSKNPLYETLLPEIFTNKLPFVELESRLLKFHSQQITFPTIQISQSTHRLIAAINSREGILSDLIGAYLMSTDLVPVIRQKRNISSLVSDHRLFSMRTQKKARYEFDDFD
jgi:hypothetical protein